MPQVTLYFANTVIGTTFADEHKPTNTNNTSTLINVSGYPGSKSRGFIHFDLGLIPNDVIINSATMRLIKGSGNVNRTVNVRRVMEPWSDTTLTWANQPAIDTADYGSAHITIPSGEVDFDITNLVQSWVDGFSPNFGLALLMADEHENVGETFVSMKSGTTSSRPRLIIDYTIPTTGKKQVEYVGSAYSAPTIGTSITVDLPPRQDGDLAVIQVTSDASTTVNFPSGWTKIYDVSNSNSQYALAYKFVASAEPLPTLTFAVYGTKYVNSYLFRNVKNVTGTRARTMTGSRNFTPVKDNDFFEVGIDNSLFVLFNSLVNHSISLSPPLSYAEIYGRGTNGYNIRSFMKYMYANRSQTATEMTSIASNTAYGISGLLVLEPLTNNQPSITLTSPADNLTLSEGTEYKIEGNMSDVDAGNIVSAWYRINNGTKRAIASGVSDGVTPISFLKKLKYSNKRLWDGATDVVGVDLAENMNHTLHVWAEDDQGGKSEEEQRTFQVIWNRPPVISGQDEDLGTLSTPPSVTYSVTDPENDSFTITEYLDGDILRTFPGVSEQEYTATIPALKWLRTSLSKHTLRIRATDSKGAYSERTYTFTRTDDKIEFALNFNDLGVQKHFILDDQPTRILVTLDGVFPTGSQVLVEACNNALDDTPTREDITGPVLAGRGYIFQNETKTADKWAINIFVTITKGTATEPVILNGFGGAFD